MPRRLALVSPGALKGSTDRLLLGVRRGRLGDLLQRSADRPWHYPGCGRRGRIGGEEREVLRLNHIRSEEDGPANDVPKLPHVPRPTVVQKELSCRFRDLAAGAAELQAGFREKVVRQAEDVVSLPEGRQRDHEFAQ